MHRLFVTEFFSIRFYIKDVLYNSRLSVCTDENVMLCLVENDVELVDRFKLALLDMFAFIKVYQTLKHLIYGIFILDPQ